MSDRTKLYQDSLDAISKIEANGGEIPEDFNLECLQPSGDLGTWMPCSGLGGWLHYRLVPIPKKRVLPHTRATWPDWRYIQGVGGHAHPFGSVTKDGVFVRNDVVSSSSSLLSWESLVDKKVSNSSHGPWVWGGIVEGS